MKAIIEIDDRQIHILQYLSRHRKDDFKDDILDGTFLTNIFKVGLVDVARFYSIKDSDPQLTDMANDYMGRDMLGGDMTAEDLTRLWGGDE